MAIFNGTRQADTIDGSAEQDFIYGGNGNDTLRGDAGDDRLFGENGSDLLSGGAGNDEIDGGNGQDVVVLAGNRADYHLTQRGDGSVVLRDLRAGSPDGTDRLFSIERVQFADGYFKIVDLISANEGPVAADDLLTLAEDSGPTDVTSILLANDSDAEGDGFAITAVEGVSAQGAVVTLGADGSVSYDPGSIFAGLEAGQTATDTFTYTITDSNGVSTSATATVTITGVSDNVAPVAADDELTLGEDAGPTDVTATLLANDTDADGDALQVTAVQAVSEKGATVTLNPDGTVNYDSGAIFNYLDGYQVATDTFTYTITDAAGATSTATATVTITGAPEQFDAYLQVEEDMTSEDMLTTFEQWLDIDIVSVDTAGTLGTVAFDGDSLTFTADDPYSDHLNYDQSHTTTFTVTGADREVKTIMAAIYGRNDDIVAIDDVFSVDEGAATANLWWDVIGNDQDVDNGTAGREILSVDTTGTLGTVSFDAYNRVLNYSAAGIDLAEGETITDTFTYKVEDGYGSTDTATVTVTVTVTGTAGGASAAIAPASAFEDGGASAFDGSFGAFELSQPEILDAGMLIG